MRWEGMERGLNKAFASKPVELAPSDGAQTVLGAPTNALFRPQ